ncbi:MAG: Rieske 2Fe-2S domain-containing protein [Verrucomicrobia bacterium]|nr:Rieske 2Fe-2S domain-containing protein [Verrucomicrobiota bacterium]
MEPKKISLVASSRRDFIESFAYTAAAGCAVVKACTNAVFGALLPEPATGAGYVQLKVENYPELQTNGQTLRLGLCGITGRRPEQRSANTNFFPLLITRSSEGNYWVVDSSCTHNGFLVESQGSVLFCPTHGSRWQHNGTRISGDARVNLKSYKTVFRSDVGSMGELAVEVPRLGYSVILSPVDSAADRLELRFTARQAITYSVMYRESLGEDWLAVQFASSATSTLDQTSFTPTTSDTTARLWVAKPATSGFFAVHTRVTKV